jgi:hypothetical protein
MKKTSPMPPGFQWIPCLDKRELGENSQGREYEAGYRRLADI